jgi:hypothetical protein
MIPQVDLEVLGVPERLRNFGVQKKQQIELWFILPRVPLDLKSYHYYGYTMLRSVQILIERFIGQMYQYFLWLKNFTNQTYLFMFKHV